jgi:hypothetical protein
MHNFDVGKEASILFFRIIFEKVKQNFNTNLNYFFSNLWNSCVTKIKYNMYKVQDYDMALFTILLTQLYVRVTILLTHGKHFT